MALRFCQKQDADGSGHWASLVEGAVLLWWPVYSVDHLYGWIFGQHCIATLALVVCYGNSWDYQIWLEQWPSIGPMNIFWSPAGRFCQEQAIAELREMVGKPIWKMPFFGLGLENSWLQLRQINVDDIGDVEGLRLFSPFKCCWFPKISSIWKGSFVFFSLTSYIEISSHLLIGNGGVLGIQPWTWGWNHDRKDQEVGAAGAHGSLWSPLCW